MQESKELQKVYGLFQKMVYFFILIECLILFSEVITMPFFQKIVSILAKMPFWKTPLISKISQLALIFFIAIGAKPKKDLEINIIKSIIGPLLIGLALMFGSLFLLKEAYNPSNKTIFQNLNIYQLLYIAASFLGVILAIMGADNISKIIKDGLGKDKWNIDQESFDQNTELVKNDYSINIPYVFYYKKKFQKGWINIDPFRGTLIIGTPGSGKSFGIIIPSIRQFVNKKYCMLIYDYKFPDLGKVAYYHYRLMKKKDANYKHKFAVVNLNDIEKSKRVNPLKPEYVKTVAQAQEMAEAIVSSLQKGGGGGGGGADAFFTQSAINFLASCISFFATYEDGKYSTLPHLLSFLNRSYEEIFTALFTNEELHSLLSPFKSSYDNKAFDQLEGQIGTLKIFLSRLTTKESFWIFSADELNLAISNKEEPTILILASDPNTQNINSALYSVVLNRLLTLINSKGNLPSAVVIDELPTIYIHKIDNLIATARSNKVAVMLGLQEIPQFKQFYKKEVADTINAIMGNILSGSARDKFTLDWLEKVFGKVRQQSQSMSVNNNQTTFSTSERMDSLIPAGKIASLKTGEMVGIIAQNETVSSKEYKSSAVNGKISLDMKSISFEEKNYLELPTYYSFVDKDGIDRKDEVLLTNFRKINREVELIVQNF